MSFDYTTYVTGGPWTSYEHMTRAAATPKFSAVLTENNATTPESYFEFRAGGKKRYVDIVVSRTEGNGAYSYAIERSDDDGVTWVPIETATDSPLALTLPYAMPFKVRGRLISVGSDTEITFQFSQHI